MVRHFVFEEQLEIDKLHEQELEANRNGLFDQTYNEIKQSDEVAKKAEEESEDTEDSETTEDSDNTTTDDEKPVEEDKTEEGSAAVESFNQYRPSMESWDSIANGAVDASKALFNASKYLVGLGVTHIPKMAGATFKGLLYSACMLSHFLVASFETVSTYIERRRNSFDNLAGDIKKLKDTLKIIKGYKEQTELTTGYASETVINSLKIGDSLDLTSNVNALSKFMANTIQSLASSFEGSIEEIRHLLASDLIQTPPSPETIVKIKTDPAGFKQGELAGYKPENENLVSFISSERIPGDAVLILMLPKPDMEDINEIAKACNDAKSLLGIDTANFKAVDKLDYMAIDDLMKFADALEKLCRECQAHEEVYERILKAKNSLKLTAKNRINKLFGNITPESKDPLLKYVQLKSMLTDKVYLTGSITLHDYASSIISKGLSFAQSNVKALSQ